MVTTALMYMAISWVGISWVKQILKPKFHRFFCMKCITFWLTLLITFNPFTAAMAALFAAMVDMYFNNSKIEL